VLLAGDLVVVRSSGWVDDVPQAGTGIRTTGNLQVRKT
jgi:hypothetical protein